MPADLIIQFPGIQIVRVCLYTAEAPLTCSAFCKVLPYEVKLLHARVSGHELWTPDAPALDIPQENSSIHLLPGEIAIAPIKPVRNKIAGCMGLFYGEGKLLDGANVFGKVYDEDMELLQRLGEEIWLNGSRFVKMELRT